ncbi:hypothetical protein [Nocardioides sp. GY 10127]|uniref:hypothetical protein n=1 Tax=Nocardioides sp. GY 10127 TaxID=2569762 RepID=UPI0010A9339F|nr:hypothetical protein [Nocardioides sp. GY 10127]TIC84115.1 hypothetical protein E8D37_04720 [Nocardioides sp. GY 10127]
MESKMTVAVHEIGHAWAYTSAGLRLRYATIRPRDARLTGVCRPWKPREVAWDTYAWIGAAGPIAEAVYTFNSEPDEFDFEDHLTAAVLTGGCDDYEVAGHMLDAADVIEALRDQLTQSWSAILSTAERLLEVGTLTGVELWTGLTPAAGRGNVAYVKGRRPAQ